MKKLSQRQAWQRIKQHFNVFATGGEQTELSATGLCNAIGELLNSELITPQTYCKMRDKLAKFKPHYVDQEGMVYWFPLDTKGAKQRVEVITEILKTL